MKPAQLVTVSALVLFHELVLIRYLGSEIPAVGFFKNLILIAAFLGIGLGLIARIPVARSYLGYAASSPLPILLVLVSSAAGWSSLPFAGVEQEAVLVPTMAFASGLVLLCVAFVTALVPMAFLGRLLGHYFDGIGNPLRAYGWNILGSLIGTLAYSIVCSISAPPLVWMAICVVFLLLLVSTARDLVTPSSAVLTAVVAATSIPLQFAASKPGDLWTPYYKVSIYPMYYASGELTGYGLQVNNTWFQRSFDMRLLGRNEEVTDEAHAGRLLRMEAPFLFTHPKRVLVLGSGLGNDTASAIYHGVERVDAVDIDPRISALSERFHPNRPYRDPRVRLYIDDARHFLESTEEKYDLILFGVLEARSLFSQFANLRLDNYVYTYEALETAKRRLTPEGSVWLNMWVPKPWVGEKFALMMRAVFDGKYLILHGINSSHYAFVASANGTTDSFTPVARTMRGVEALDNLVPDSESITVPTDDWPYIFYRARSLPLPYLVLVGSLVALSLGAFRVVHRGKLRIQWVFFFLGAAFLLVETSAVVRMALVAGTTWVVNSAVFVGVLVFILLANWGVGRWRFRRRTLWFLALFLSLGVAYGFPFAALLDLPNRLAIAIAAGLLTLPVFFSGVIFSSLLSEVDVPSRALSSNLLGAILGGFSEYLSLLVGNRAMSLAALGLYLVALLLLEWERDPR